MKQKFWGQLKTKLCPKENWHRDQDYSKCQCCRKDFNVIYRRRHHCRFCGKVFCSNCSDFYINGNYLGLSQKYVRHCQFCREEIEKVKRDLNKLTSMMEDEEEIIGQDSGEEENSSDDSDKQFFSMKAIFGQEDQDEMHLIELDGQIRNNSRKLLKMLIEAHNLSPQILQGKLLDFANKAVVECRMNILPNNFENQSNYMDVAKYINIKTIVGTGNFVELIRGIALWNRMPIKKMARRLQHPQVIIIENHFDETLFASKLKFEEIVTEEGSMLQKLGKKIMTLNPDIIFVEKAISLDSLKFFSHNNISVVSRLKKKDIFSLMKISGIRQTIKDIWNLQKYKMSSIIGNCDTIRIKSFQEDQTLVYLEKNIGVRSLIISEKSPENRANFKKCTQFLLRYIRKAHLEKYLVVIDTEMQKTANTNISNLILKLSPLPFYDRFKEKEVRFHQFALSHTDFHELDKKTIDYSLAKGVTNFYEICGKIEYECIKIYSENDMTLGNFLLTMATNFLKQCSECQRPHKKRFYFNRKGIEIGVKMIKATSEVKIKEEQDLTVENMRKFVKKYKQQLNIMSYFSCRKCDQILCKKIKIGKNYLKNSFYNFLDLLSSSQTQVKMIKVELKGESLKKCRHLLLDRVFETSDLIFKFSDFGFKVYSVSFIDLTSEYANIIISANSTLFLKEMTNQEIIEKSGFANNLITVVNSLLQIISTKTSPSGNRLAVEKQRLECVREIFLKLQNQLVEVENRQKLKEVSKQYDWTIFMREIIKAESIIRCGVDLVANIQNKLLKFKLVDEHIPIINQSVSEQVSEYSQDQSIAQQDISLDQIVKDLSLNRQPSSREKKQTSVRNSSDQTTTINSILNDKSLLSFTDRIKRKRYPLRKGVYLYHSACNYKDPVTVLSSALNSPEFDQAVSKSSESHVKITISFWKEVKTSWTLKAEIDKLVFSDEGVEDEKKEIYEIIAYFHHDFEQLRQIEGIKFENYVKSLCGCQSWNNSGGKSQSSFAKSYDDILVVKTIKEKEFVEFHKFASEYLEYVKRAKAKSLDSLLAKIFGLYEVTIRNKTYKCIVMQNIFFGLHNVTKVYDLKGSEVNRLQIPKDNKKYTGLDNNFKIDKNFHPYVINQSFNQIMKMLAADVHFLEEQQVIDYSLLVVEDADDNLRMGIIDFMRPYHLSQKVEKIYKEIKTGGLEPTVIPPNLYAERFMCAIHKYFMGQI